MSPLTLTLSILGAVFLLVGSILVVVFSTLKKRRERFLHELQSEGILLDSGSRRAVFRFRNFRSRRFATTASVQGTWCHLVLTKINFVILGDNLLRIPYAELGRYAVRAENGKLIITTDQPIGATGHMELTINVDDPEAWISALANLAPNP